MSAWSDGKAALASRLITKRGQLMSLSRPGPTSASGDRSVAPLGTAHGILSSKLLVGGSSSQVALEAVDFGIRPGDLLDVPDRGRWNIDMVDQKSPDGGLIAYILGVSQ